MDLHYIFKNREEKHTAKQILIVIHALYESFHL